MTEQLIIGSAIKSAIDSAVETLKTGGVIAYPTEGVWGLGCDPFNEQAVDKILALKQRAVEKGLILVAGSIEQTAVLTDRLSPDYFQLLQASWPGPRTWLIPDPDNTIPGWIKGDFETAAIRVTDHPLVISICMAYGGMIVSTSANPAQDPPAMNRKEVDAYFAGSIDYIVDGELGGLTGPSEIRDLMSQTVLRQ